MTRSTVTVSILLLFLGGCCLGASVSSGTGEAAGSGSSETGASTGTGSGSGTGGVASSGTSTSTGAAAGDGTGTTTGTCGAAALTLAPDPIDFGHVPLNETSTKCTTVTNPCGPSISITGIADFTNEGGAYAGPSTDDLPITIEGGGHAQVCFSLTPPITQQYRGQATLLTSDLGGDNPVVHLTGWGGGPEIVCTPLTLAFNVAVGQSETLPVTCTNAGSAVPGGNLLIGPLDAVGGVFSAAFDPDVDPYPSDGLEPGQSAQIDVTYTPIDETGDYGVLPIPNNGNDGQTIYVSLSGNER